MKRNKKLLFFMGILLTTVSRAEPETVQLIPFSTQKDLKIPTAWQPQTFDKIDRHTEYSLVLDNAIPVLQARSEASASGLISHIRFNPYDYPYISWRWKTDTYLTDTDARKKSKDDYALRLYINFDTKIESLPVSQRLLARLYQKVKGKKPPLASLNYIWANHLAKGSIIANPYTQHVQMVVLQNKRSKTGVWYSEQRNIVKDYIAAFAKPPGDVLSIAVMTDSDNTLGHAISYYGDIRLAKTP